jgi:hypothetical protein
VAIEKLTKEGLDKPNGVFALGITVAKDLAESNLSILFINLDGEVERCSYAEILLDAEGEEHAINQLLNREYTDEMIIMYLKGRKARHASNL